MDKYILSDRNKFYNWIYPKYEETIMTKTMHPNPIYNNFELSEGQKYVKDFSSIKSVGNQKTP